MAQQKRGYRKAVFVVVYKKQDNKIKYLILKRKLHWKGWEFTKGGVEKNEPEMLTVMREVKEESGLTPVRIINHRKKGKYNYKKILPDRPYLGQKYSLYSAQVSNKSKKIKIDKHEHEIYKWVDFQEAIKTLSWKDQKQCLIIVDRFLVREMRKGRINKMN
ncbi:NUDIX domain-containing protein [Candidatus Pacearchaeota archaeon]|nr:NUDIX domain-containing protein [Candidatus Pacearchaeota archaeon]